MLTADQIVTNNGQIGAFACAKASSGAAGLFQFLCGWEEAMGVALVTSAVLLACIYIFGVLFRNEGLRSFVRLELSELFVTVVLVALIIVGVRAVTDFDVGDFLSQNQLPTGATTSMSVYSVAESYFTESGKAMGQWLEMDYVMGVFVDTAASVTSQPRPMGVGLVAPPFAGLASPFKQLLYNMSTALSLAYVMNYAQYYVYLFALAASLNYYIPLGVILRSFTPTRRIGGSLIGLGLAFIFVFPVLYALNYGMFFSPDAGQMETFRSFLTKQFDTSSGASGAMKTLFCGNPNAQAGSCNASQTSGFIDMVTSLIGSIGNMFTSVLGYLFTILMVIPISVIGRAFAIGFVMPAFNILLMVQATRFISKALGEEIDISTLTRMV